MMRGVWIIVIAGLLAACNSIKYIGIETFHPAEITFPDQVSNVLIVNNAVPQPPESGCFSEINGVAQDACHAGADSAITAACYSLGKAIAGADYFNDVLYYNEPTRNDNDYLSEKRLTAQQVNSLCLSNNADAIISLDRLLFTSHRSILEPGFGYWEGNLKVQANALFRVHIPGRESALATLIVEDSVFWNEAAQNPDVLNLFLPSPDAALTMAGTYIGDRTFPNFVPFWMNDARWYYPGIATTWKEGVAYIKANKWESAQQIWEENYNGARRNIQKAKAASNLALCHEMLGELEEARKWAELSLRLFTGSSHRNEENKTLLKQYVTVLASRITTDKKLNQQMGL